MSRVTSSDRVRRILSIVPWVAERDGATIDEISARFAIDRKELLADLDVVFMVGIPPYTPDTMIDVLIEDDRVWITLGDYFRRPLRLTPAEGLRLLAAGHALAAIPGYERDGSLARGLEKLAIALGVGGEGEFEVSLGDAPVDTLDTLRRAVGDRRQVEIDYYSFGRDTHTARVVDPYRVSVRDGHWYVVAWCHLADAERVFRVDRIASVSPLDSTFELPDHLPDLGYAPSDSDLIVTLRLAQTAAWVIEHHPVMEVVNLADGRIDVTLGISALPWLARLLVRLGPEVEVVAASDEAAVDGLQRSTAAQILRRYGSSTSTR